MLDISYQTFFIVFYHISQIYRKIFCKIKKLFLMYFYRKMVTWSDWSITLKTSARRLLHSSVPLPKCGVRYGPTLAQHRKNCCQYCAVARMITSICTLRKQFCQINKNILLEFMQPNSFVVPTKIMCYIIQILVAQTKFFVRTTKKVFLHTFFLSALGDKFWPKLCSPTLVFVFLMF